MPNDHGDHPDLFGLLNGELGNAATGDADDHLAGCETCRTELAGIVAGHALMRRSARVHGDRAIPDADPPPPLAARAGPPRHRMILALAVVAAVAALLGAGLVAGLSDREPAPSVTPSAPTSPSDPVQLPAAKALLEPVSVAAGSSARGEVTMRPDGEHQTRMRIDTSGLRPAGAHRFYYAWLLDPDTLKMLPLGQVGPGGAAYQVDDGILGSYSAVDISLERDDGDPGHSSTSVLRGTY